METQSQSEQPAEKPEEVALPATDATPDDTLPLTVDEFKAAGREVIERVKHGFLVPAYRLGRRYIRSIEGAADSFFEGVASDNQRRRPPEDREDD